MWALHKKRFCYSREATVSCDTVSTSSVTAAAVTVVVEVEVVVDLSVAEPKNKTPSLRTSKNFCAITTRKLIPTT